MGDGPPYGCGGWLRPNVNWTPSRSLSLTVSSKMVVKISLGMSLMCMLMVYERKRISGLVVHQMDLENKENGPSKALKVFVLLRRKTKKKAKGLAER